MKNSCAYAAMVLVCSMIAPISSPASQESIGPDGINSAGLTLFNGMPLNGNGIRVGQVEDVRPSLPGYDDPANSNSFVVPSGIFIQDGQNTTPNTNLGTNLFGHGTWVAGTIISTDSVDSNGNGDAPIGVAPMADLYASAYVTTGASLAAYRDYILSAQYIANSVGAPAINYSAQKAKLAPADPTDGNSQLTLGLDWIANRYDTLNVVAGYEALPTPSGRPLPTDQYNGMTVGSSSKIGNVFRGVSAFNNYSEDASGDRTSMSIIAPGDDIELADLGVGNPENNFDGTSFAAPHVTGTATLLRQYAEERIMNAPSAQWGANARHHEVMKAVLMNSADKIEEGSAPPPGALPIPVGGLLGMERTVVMQDGTSTWFDSFAYEDSIGGQGQFFPLDEQMGAGHLNANRALTQFRTGEQDYDAGDVPLIGWDFDTTTGTDLANVNRYQFEDEILGGSFVSIMLAWDRDVTFATDTAPTNIYNDGDSFAPYVDDGINPPDDSVINDLSLYLLPKGGAFGQAKAASISNVGTVEHIFFQIPETGEYEFWVFPEDDDVGSSQDYAVAWWAVSATPPALGGDFDGDDDVDGDDLGQWKGDFGVNDESDADNDGDSDGADFLTWQQNFGAGVPVAPASVPEPSAWLLGVLGLPLLLRRRVA